ncbi:RluA family pseudouridine synthase [Cyanobacterium stanieri LEGE 03274]|uniref:RNA pseudouridylate synthase n=1 Tax=Cyanobacterium stanieri LEGE 03274 TaxID=1828756 RepID=A0ABR9V036_9CHRO|nr:pseudouridine synthase [Cyanobacterium stanieri]MBE9221238.1 RluA family pseudouridine synthase [Cyanobacterium stanieri LEGE 03274]
MVNDFSDTVENFLSHELLSGDDKVTYWYEGYCPKTNQLLRLPRTTLAEKIAYELMDYLREDGGFDGEGKMYGILLCEDNSGRLKVIKAFSGLWKGRDNISGWVNQIPGRKKFAMAEKITLAELDRIKGEIILLESLAVREEYQLLEGKYNQDYQKLREIHRERKRLRNNRRKYYQESLEDILLQEKLENLAQESRKDDWERRTFKKKWNNKLAFFKKQIYDADKQIQELKKKRKNLSRQLQSQMQGAYCLTNFAGETLSLSELVNKSFIPTGTGDCCAPKLLHYAAVNSLKPIAMAEFWWGLSSPNGEKILGNFYPACVERCQPIMGFLLSGLDGNTIKNNDYDMEIIYEDSYFLVVNKPSGLLSVPGRGSDKFDSVESRLKVMGKGGIFFRAVHRLDQDTSGILVIAKSLDCYKYLSQQFATRRVKKVYEALLAGVIVESEGKIDLPLWANPDSRPLQEVSYRFGKDALTVFRVMGCDGVNTRVEFLPITGRTHQLRVHSLMGLGFPIRGDRLYGFMGDNRDRLHLHAREISFHHPNTGEKVFFNIPCPF